MAAVVGVRVAVASCHCAAIRRVQQKTRIESTDNTMTKLKKMPFSKRKRDFIFSYFSPYISIFFLLLTLSSFSLAFSHLPSSFLLLFDIQLGAGAGEWWWWCFTTSTIETVWTVLAASHMALLYHSCLLLLSLVYIPVELPPTHPVRFFPPIVSLIRTTSFSSLVNPLLANHPLPFVTLLAVFFFLPPKIKSWKRRDGIKTDRTMITTRSFPLFLRVQNPFL